MTCSNLSVVVQALAACQNNTEQAYNVLIQQKQLKILGVEHETFDDLDMKSNTQELGSDYFKYGLDIEVLDNIVLFYERQSEELPHLRRRLQREKNYNQEFLEMLQNDWPLIFDAILQNVGVFVTIKYGFDPQKGQDQYNYLSLMEMEAVERLMSLGFETDRIIEAFMMNGKDEARTADFLFMEMESDRQMNKLTQLSQEASSLV